MKPKPFLISMHRSDTLALLRLLTAITRPSQETDSFICNAITVQEREVIHQSRTMLNWSINPEKKLPKQL